MPAATRTDSIPRTRSPSPAVGAALTICWVCQVLMSWQVTASMTGAANLLRDCDLCGRFGGEEFALLLPRTTAAQALEITERIRQGISQLAVPRNGTAAIRVTISIGVAVPSQTHRTLDDLLAAADHALYRAKRSGRDRVVIVTDTVVPQASRPLPLARTSVLLS
jgi:Diguanylate cyclase, GGDEF domain